MQVEKIFERTPVKMHLPYSGVASFRVLHRPSKGKGGDDVVSMHEFRLTKTF